MRMKRFLNVSRALIERMVVKHYKNYQSTFYIKQKILVTGKKNTKFNKHQCQNVKYEDKMQTLLKLI